MKKGFAITGAFVLIALLLLGVASADVSFTVNDGADVADADFDIVKAGAYGSGDKVVFWMEVRGNINLNPPDGYYYTYEIDIYTNGGKSISVSVYAYASGGSTFRFASLITDTSTSTLTEGTDYVISGSKISFYLDKTIENLWNSGVDTVDFYTGKTNGGLSDFHTDEVTYYSSGGGTSGGTSGGTGGTEAPPMWLFFLPGIIGIVCLVIWLVIWLIIAFWAYKDAKERGMSSPIIAFLLVFFLGIIGLIIYILIRPKERQSYQQQQYYQPPPPPPQ